MTPRGVPTAAVRPTAAPEEDGRRGERTPHRDRRVPIDVERPETPRLPILRPGGLLRVHASDGHGQWARSILLPLGGATRRDLIQRLTQPVDGIALALRELIEEQGAVGARGFASVA